MDRFNKRKFILKGSLALEGYFEVYGNNKINLLKEYNEKLRKYYALKEKDKESQRESWKTWKNTCCLYDRRW